VVLFRRVGAVSPARTSEGRARPGAAAIDRAVTCAPGWRRTIVVAKTLSFLAACSPRHALDIAAVDLLDDDHGVDPLTFYRGNTDGQGP